MHAYIILASTHPAKSTRRTTKQWDQGRAEAFNLTGFAFTNDLHLLRGGSTQRRKGAKLKGSLENARASPPTRSGTCQSVGESRAERSGTRLRDTERGPPSPQHHEALGTTCFPAVFSNPTVFAFIPYSSSAPACAKPNQVMLARLPACNESAASAGVSPRFNGAIRP